MIIRTVIAAGLLWVVPAFGQSVQDRDVHHPDGDVVAQQQPAQPEAPQAGRTGPGMIGSNMMGQGQAGPAGMMPMMMNMMMGMQSGADHIEGRLGFIKAELKITDAQTTQWSAFADALRSNANSMFEMRTSMTSGQGVASTLPDKLALEEKAVTAHLAAIKKTQEAVAKFYSVLTNDQKKIADTIVIGPMGIPMGMR